MDWEEHFGGMFFKAWQKAGLPDPMDYHKDYVQSRYGVVFVNRFIEEPFESALILEENVLTSIYGFGALHGKMFIRLLNLDDTATIETSDWCGRFNLGISTFDYLSDETTGGIHSVISLDAFDSFTQENKSSSLELTAAEEFLNNLTASVLNDLINLEKQNESANDLMTLMQQLFKAQVFLSGQSLTNTQDLAKIKQALFLKSAEPFRVMAEYALGIARNKSPKVLGQARALGTAIGFCYWLIDDAKDVWIDLEAGEWNIFLQLAAEHNDAIFNKLPNHSIKDDLKNFWKENDCAEHLINKAINDLLQATKELEVPESDIKHELGVLGSSLWHWIKF